MNGILVIDKPKDYTSRDIVNIISKKLNTKKIGHMGTLDPIATGVLVLGLGKALKLGELLTNEDKEYIATVKLGLETDTLDITGTTIYKNDNFNINTSDIEKVLTKFKGKIKQEVPKYSAVKINGKKLYEYARNNIEVKLPIREVEIFDIKLINKLENNEFSFSCKVSKGTYIRSLIRDIGRELGSYATMIELRRTKQGKFKIDDSYSLDDVLNNKYKIMDIKDVLNIPKVIVNEKDEFKVKNGQVMKKFFNSKMAMILNKDRKLLAIYQKKDHDYVKPYKVF